MKEYIFHVVYVLLFSKVPTIGNYQEKIIFIDSF